ncbi:MAG: hypothetical protein ABIP49_03780 [Lysobacterales bacterium]
MNIDAHLAKARRIESSLAKCTHADFETVIEGAMLAGTHWFNALLHLGGLRTAEHDAVHAEFVSLGERRKLAVAIPAALQALDQIESLRTSHVRGNMPNGEQAAKSALDCLAQLRESALSKL